jgi:hypothetical protein
MNWFLLHNNASEHIMLNVPRFLSEMGLLRSRPTKSPVSVLADFCLFTKLQMKTKGKQFQTNENIQMNVTNYLNEISTGVF